MDAGILIARVMLGLAIGAHGAQKVFGWFGGHGRKGTGVFFNVTLRRSPQTKAHA